MNSKKAFVLSIIVFGIGIFFEVVTPPLFYSFVENKFTLLPGSELRKAYKDSPFNLSLKVFMFNLTNPNEVTHGGKPKLQQIGPYFFEERRKKFDQHDDDSEDTWTYSYRKRFIFRADLSGPGLSGNEIITMPHPLIAMLFLAINVDKKPLLPMVQEAVNIIFGSREHIYYTGRVMDILFDGIPIDCTSDAFQAKALCSAFEDGMIRTIQPIDDEDHYAFSLFAAMNGTESDEITVSRGAEDSQDLGRVVAINGEREMDVWDDEECDEYRGTDSTIFLPPFMNDTDGIWVFEPNICRPLHAHYVGTSKSMGIDTSEFHMDFGSPENTKQCFCRDGEQCPKKGTFDMFACVDVPLTGSLPHFYRADPSLVANFDSGMNPVKEDHEAYFHVEMTTGILLAGAKRVQFNLEVLPIEHVSYMSKLREMYYPMFWMEETMVLKEQYLKLINLITLVLTIQQYLKWAGIIFGGCGILIASISMLSGVKSSNRGTMSPNLKSRNVYSINRRNQ